MVENEAEGCHTSMFLRLADPGADRILGTTQDREIHENVSRMHPFPITYFDALLYTRTMR